MVPLRPLHLALLATTLVLLPQASAHQTVTGSSSTGEVDLYDVIAPTVPCQLPPTDLDCLVMVCPADIYTFTIRLELLDPSPGDAVLLTQVGDPPSLIGGLPPPGAYPSDLATDTDPVAEVVVQLGGCNRATQVAVTGLVVTGSVSYELTY